MTQTERRDQYASFETIEVIAHPQWVQVTLARPKARNAMSAAMVAELRQLFSTLREDTEIQAVVLRGAGGHFCAGGDVRDMRDALSKPLGEVELSEDLKGQLEADPIAQLNRVFGTMLSEIQEAPQTVIVALEGAVMGGGFGLACVSDIAFALPSARFGLPEVTLGVTPAQIAPFVVARVGLTRARQLALTGARFNADAALAYGLVHEVCADEGALETRITETLQRLSRCAPQARIATKSLLLSIERRVTTSLLDQAALRFAEAAREGEGMEGMMAFISKKPASWQEAWGEASYSARARDTRPTSGGES